MSGNRSLDEFAGVEEDGSADDGEASGDVGASSDEGAGGGRTDAAVDADADERAPVSADVDDRGGLEADDGDVAVDSEAPEPPASTYAWSPDGGTCAGCGETVDERWRDGEDLVCVGCKEW